MSSIRVSGVSYADKAFARAAEASMAAMKDASSPARWPVDAKSAAIVSTIPKDMPDVLEHNDAGEQQREKQTQAATTLNADAPIFVPPLSAYVEPDAVEAQQSEQESEDTTVSEADVNTVQHLRRPRRHMLFNVKCRYYNDGKDGCIKPGCQFLHEEEPIYHDILSIETSTTSSESGYCGLCDSPVNGTFYYMSFATLDQAYETAEVPETTELIETPDFTRIYVGNMPIGCNKTYLRTLLSSVDVAVLNVGINRSKLSCKHRSAFVQVNTADARRAIDTLNDHSFDGTTLYARIKEWDEFESSPREFLTKGAC